MSVTDEASDFKFGMQLGFAKAHHKIIPRRKNLVWILARELPEFIKSHADEKVGVALD